MLIFNKDITVNLRVVTGKASLALEDNLRFGKFNDVEIWEMLDTIFVGNNDGEDRLLWTNLEMIFWCCIV